MDPRASNIKRNIEKISDEQRETIRRFNELTTKITKAFTDGVARFPNRAEALAQAAFKAIGSINRVLGNIANLVEVPPQDIDEAVQQAESFISSIPEK